MSALRGPPRPTYRTALAGIVASLGTVGVLWVASPGLRLDAAQLGVALSRLDVAAWQHWIASLGPWAWLLFVLAVIAQAIVAPIPATPLVFAGALVFGVWESIALSLVGSVIGAVIVFGAVRRWGTPLVTRLFGRDTVDRYVGRLDDHGWWLLAILLVPFLPDDVLSALAGLSALSLRRFMVITMVGRVPAIATAALLGSDVVTGSTAAAITAAAVVGVLVVLGLAYRTRVEAWILRRAGGTREDARGQRTGGSAALSADDRGQRHAHRRAGAGDNSASRAGKRHSDRRPE